jgi:hypothetical protein
MIDGFSHREVMTAGKVVWTWCSTHGYQTDHLYDGHKLICLACHPECKPAEKGVQP